MKYLTAIIAILILATAGADIASARRRNSINTRLKTDKTLTQEAVAEPFDSISATADSVRFYGYEKTLRSTRETMFVSNLCRSRSISALIFTITYTDTKGRQLHRRRVEHRTDIPAGETRRIDIPSWDRQQTFYYTGSPRPRTAAIPYDVTITPDTLLLDR